MGLKELYLILKYPQNTNKEEDSMELAGGSEWRGPSRISFVHYHGGLPEIDAKWHKKINANQEKFDELSGAVDGCG